MKQTTTKESEMQETIERMQDQLKRLDPEKETQLDEMFVDYVSSVYMDPNTTREQKNEEARAAEVVYAQALTDALRDNGIRL